MEWSSGRNLVMLMLVGGKEPANGDNGSKGEGKFSLVVAYVSLSVAVCSFLLASHVDTCVIDMVDRRRKAQCFRLYTLLQVPTTSPATISYFSYEVQISEATSPWSE